MEMEYLAGEGTFWVYIILAIGGWLFQLYKKNQKKAEGEGTKQFYGEDREIASSSSTDNFDQVVKDFAKRLRLDVEEEVIEETIPQESMVNSLDELQEKYGAETIVEEPKVKRRFSHYALDEEENNPFGEKLHNKKDLKEAFVLSEILRRPEY